MLKNIQDVIVIREKKKSFTCILFYTARTVVPPVKFMLVESINFTDIYVQVSVPSGEHCYI